MVEPRVYPGVHFALPWPIERVWKLKVRQLQRLVIGGDPADLVLGRTQPLASQFLTGDQNIIQMRVVVQYSVGVPADYLFRTRTRRRAPQPRSRPNWRAASAAHRGRRSDHRKLAIQDARARPRRGGSMTTAPAWTGHREYRERDAAPEAADAFRDVASARADTARIFSEAQSYANDLLPRARGEAQQMTESAAAYQAPSTKPRRRGPLHRWRTSTRKRRR